MTKTAYADEELPDRTAQCTTITGNKECVKSKSFDQLSIHDAANSNSNSTSATRDEEGETEDQQWLRDGRELNESRQRELGDGPAVLRDRRNEKSTVFLTAASLLKEHWPSQFSLDDVTNIIAKLEGIPYMKNCLKAHIAKAKSVLAGESVVNANLTKDQEEILALLSEEKAREQIRQEFLKLHSIKDELYSIKDDISSTLIDVERKTVEVKNQLLYLAGMSQAESSVTHTSTATCTAPASLDKRSPNKKQKTDERSEIFVLAEPKSIISSVVSNYLDIEQSLPDLCKVSHDAADSEARLIKVVKIIEDYLAEATFLTGDQPDYKAKVEAAMKSLQTEIRNATTPDFHFGGSEMATLSEQKTRSSMPAEKYAPGPAANERDGTHPWIQLLFQSIGACWEPLSSMAQSPGKISIRKEAPIPSTELRPKRSMDFLLRKKGRWEAVIFDDILTVPVEAKPGCRKSKGPIMLLDEAVEQILSHFAKRLFIGFNFARYGVPCHITGIVVCMGAIQILQLRYQNVGTPDAKLVLYKSARLPLMKADHFEKWADTSGQKDRFTELKHDLYGLDEKGGIDEKGIPKGIRVLFNVMNQPSKRLYGLSVDVEDTDPKILGVPLGSGTSSIVFRNMKDASRVVKLSQYGIKRDIVNETKILKACSNDHLPRITNSDVIKKGMLKIKLGSVETALPAIELSPAGQNASAYLTKSDDIHTGLTLIVEGITSALKHMHEQRIVHCDVTPKNIIIAEDPEPRAVLIDFSIAKFFTESISGFHGTPDYAHREIFVHHLTDKIGWKAQPKHDWASLGFTLAFFTNKCIRPWDANHPRRSVKKKDKTTDLQKLKESMEERLQKARDVIRTAGGTLEGTILEFLGNDEFCEYSLSKLAT